MTFNCEISNTNDSFVYDLAIIFKILMQQSGIGLDRERET
jgi:hypothetical protein